jgi:hypothetical protein
MNTELNSVENDMSGQIDRLVCGELNETDRKRLLAWFEADPVRWRLCGVAFLEAQAWSRAIEHWPRTDEPRDIFASSCEHRTLPRSPVSRRAHYRHAAAVAAVIIAFGLGLALRDFSSPPQHVTDTAAPTVAVPNSPDADLSAGPSNLPPKQESVLASVSVETAEGRGRSMPIQIPVVPAARDAGRHREQAEISDYVRQQLERRGFKVSLERRFMFARLADGQKVVVPVDQLRVNPLPIHIN